MKRQKRIKEQKVRTTITLDESVLEEIGLYVDNLSAYINACLKNKIEIEKAREIKEQEEERQRIITVMSTKEKEEILKVAKYNWVNRS